MDFAKKQLEKYGWREGQGLGRNEDGIKSAIKPKLKFDTSGVGHNIGDQFTNNWWERLFDTASNNINVNVHDGRVKVKLKSEKSVEISTKNYSKNAFESNPKMTYGSFLRTSKLTNSGIENYEVPRVATIEEHPKKFVALSDEQLFAACGGRTAHKGARHGLKLSGKLSRIEKQEKLLLKKMKNVSLADEEEVKASKKVKKLQKEKKKYEMVDSSETNANSAIVLKNKKRGKKSVSFNETVVEYCIPHSDSSSVNENSVNEGQNDLAVSENNFIDEGIVQDIESNNNRDPSFDNSPFVVNDLSKAERKKLKKKRKLEGKNRATLKFLDSIKLDKNTDQEMVSGDKIDKCKKRKLVDAKYSECKRLQSEIELPQGIKRKKEKKKKHKEKKKLELSERSDKQINNITAYLGSFCKISDDE